MATLHPYLEAKNIQLPPLELSIALASVSSARNLSCSSLLFFVSKNVTKIAALIILSPNKK